MKTSIIALIAAAAMTPVPVLAQTSTAPASPQAQGAAAPSDQTQGAGAPSAQAPSTQKFVAEVEGGNQYEIEAAKLAEKQGSGRAIKTFARVMVRDHTRLGKQFTAAVKRDKKAKLPKTSPIPSDLQQNLDKLKSEKGSTFDTDYAQQMVQSHEQTVQALQAYAHGGDDAIIKAAAKKALPVVRRHLTMAHKLPSGSAGSK